MIRAVLLDAGGVIFFPDEDQVQQLIGPRERAELLRLHYLGMRQVDVDSDGESYWPAYLEAAGSRADAGQIERARHIGWSSPAPAATGELRKLAEHGLELAVVSNTEGGVEGELRRHGIAQVGPGEGVSVASVVMSSAVGVAKPDPRIFEIALQALHARPDQCVHVGDSVYYDVGGAHAAGIHALHLDPFGLCRDTRHAHIAALGDIVLQLEALSLR